MLWLYKRVVFGEILNNDIKNMIDLKHHEMIILWSLAIMVLFFGFYPDPLFKTINFSVTNFISEYNQNINLNIANK